MPLGTLAFAGNEWGDASYGAPYPEKPWYGAVAPRLGACYALNGKTVIRSRMGHLLRPARSIPGWGGGMNAGRLRGQRPASTARSAVSSPRSSSTRACRRTTTGRRSSPASTERPGLMYRTVDGNKRPHSQQWNMSVDRELAPGFALESRVRRLPPAAGCRQPTSR